MRHLVALYENHLVIPNYRIYNGSGAKNTKIHNRFLLGREDTMWLLCILILPFAVLAELCKMTK